MLHILSPSHDWYDKLLNEPVLYFDAPHFTWKECRCRGTELGPKDFDCCWGRICIHEKILLKAEEIRAVLGDKPLTIQSGYRCNKWNEQVGGKVWSRHIEGLALDIKFDFYELDEVYDKVTKLLPFSGLGLYNWGIHIDMDTSHGKRRWDSRKDL